MSLNCTDVNGTLVRVVHVSNDPQTTPADKSNADDSYDGTGAMQFIVATVLVYSILGVFCVLISRIKRLSGQSHTNYIHDESVNRYLKDEKMLKGDTDRLRLMYECELIANRLKSMEGKEKLLDLEEELTSDFLQENYPEGEKTRKTQRKEHDTGSTLVKMGTSLIYISTNPTQQVNNELPDHTMVDNNHNLDRDHVIENCQTDLPFINKPDQTGHVECNCKQDNHLLLECPIHLRNPDRVDVVQACKYTDENVTTNGERDLL